MEEFNIDFFYECFISLLPCYLFVIPAIYSMYNENKMSQDFEYKGKGIEDSSGLEDDSSTPLYSFSRLKMNRNSSQKRIYYENSFKIKMGISFLFVFTYFILLLLTFTNIPDNLLIMSVHPICRLVYLVGILAWGLNCGLLKIENEIERTDAFLILKIFWVFNFICLNIRLFQSYNFSIDFAFYVFKFPFGLILVFYAFYSVEKDQNSCLAKLIQKFENFSFIRFLFKLKSEKLRIYELTQYNKDKYSKFSPKISPTSKISGSENNSFKINLNPIKSETTLPPLGQENYLLSQLPKLKKLYIKKIKNEENEHYFQITTHINQKAYISEKSFTDFIDLQNELKNFFANENIKYTSKIPDFKDYWSKLNDIDMINVLENYLKIFIKNPCLLIDLILNFLNVEKDVQINFNKYQDYLFKNKSSLSNFKLNPLKILNKQYSSGRSLETTPRNYTGSPSKNNFIFDIKCLKYIKKKDQNTEFEFEINLLNFDNPQKWTILKTYHDFEGFNKNLEEFDKTLNLFHEFVPKVGFKLNEEMLIIRQRGLEKYLQTIVSDKKYFKQILFDFLEFDAESELPINRMETSFSISNSDGKTFDFIESQEKSQDLFVIDFGTKSMKSIANINSPGLFPKKRISNGIDFNYVTIRMLMIKNQKDKNYFVSAIGNNLKKELYIIYYYFVLEECDSFNKIKTQIKMVKKYCDFKLFNQLIWTQYNEYDVNIPKLPIEIDNYKQDYDPKLMKKKWDLYFNNLLTIPRIEQNETFLEFFNLNRLGIDFKYNRKVNETEYFDFTQL